MIITLSPSNPPKPAIPPFATIIKNEILPSLLGMRDFRLPGQRVTEPVQRNHMTLYGFPPFRSPLFSVPGSGWEFFHSALRKSGIFWTAAFFHAFLQWESILRGEYRSDF
jgi:hypothetical protein